MVGVCSQRPLGAETGCRRQFWDQPSQPARRQRGVHVDAGQVGGAVTERGVQVVGARRGVVGPRRVVPAMSPYRLARVSGRIVGDHLDAVRARAGRAQIQPADGQAGRAEVDVAVHECRRHEAAVEIHHLGVGELATADVVTTQPRHNVAAHRHSGGVGMGRTVHPAIHQQRGGNLRHTAKTTGFAEAGRSGLATTAAPAFRLL